MAGCCYGRPTSLPWGIVFTDAFTGDYVGTPLGVALHPTQVYEVIAETAILFFLLRFERRGRSFAGRTFWTYILLYGLSRYVIEFFRGDPRGTVLFLSTSQFISVVLVPLSVLMLAYLSQRRQPDAAAAFAPGTDGEAAAGRGRSLRAGRKASAPSST
jgi:phosphatidylglycerol:prolipoprotein diacylglycerol transferase